MNIRPLSLVDPRFKDPAPTWWGGDIQRGNMIPWTPPALVGMWDPTINQVVYPQYVQLKKAGTVGARLYRPKGTPS